jgi:hypothetical protein
MVRSMNRIPAQPPQSPAASPATDSFRPPPSHQPLGKLAVEHRECLDIPLRMPPGRTRPPPAHLHSNTRRRMPNLLRPIQPFHHQPVRVLLPPVDAAFLAIDAKRTRSTRPQPPATPSAPPRRYSTAQVALQSSSSRRPSPPSAAWHSGQSPPARSHIPADERHGCRCRQCIPRARSAPDRRATRPASARWFRSAWLNHPCKYSTCNLANLPQLSAGADRPRLPHHSRIRHKYASARKAARTWPPPPPVQRLFIGGRSGLVAHHRKPRLQRSHGYRQVQDYSAW